MIMALGDFAVDLRVTSLTIPAFTLRRSSRLIPGFRGRPEVMTMMSEPAVSSYPLVPVTNVSYPYTGPDCIRSSAFPCGIPSTMSTSTTSQKSFSASRCAVLAPTFPAPITVIFFRLIWVLLRSFANGLRHPFRLLPAAAFGPYLFAMTSSANSELGQNEHLEQRLCFLRRHEIRDRQRLDRGVSLPPSQVYSIQREWGCQGKTGGFGRGGPLTSPPLLCVCFLAPRYSFRAASTPPTSTFSATREPPRSIFPFPRIRRRPSSCSNRSTAAIVCSFVTRTGIPNVSARCRGSLRYPGRRIYGSTRPPGSFLLRHRHPDVQFPELLRIDRRGGVGHETGTFLGLREGDHVPQRFRPRQDHREPVQPKGDPSVGGGPELQRFQEETEFPPGLLRPDVQQREHLRLHLPPVDPDAPAPDLRPVQHHVVGLRPGFPRVAVQQRNVFVQRRREGMVHRIVPLLLLVPFQEGEIGHPQEIVAGPVDEVGFLADVQPETREGVAGDEVLVRHDQEKIPRLRTAFGPERLDLVVTEMLRDRRREARFGHLPPGDPARTADLRDLLQSRQ